MQLQPLSLLHPHAAVFVLGIHFRSEVSLRVFLLIQIFPILVLNYISRLSCSCEPKQHHHWLQKQLLIKTKFRIPWLEIIYFHGTNVKMFVNFHVISSSFQTETKLKLQQTLWPFLWLDNASNSVHWFDPANPDGKGCVFLFGVIGQVVVGYNCNWLRSECHSPVNGFEWGFRIILTLG